MSNAINNNSINLNNVNGLALDDLLHINEHPDFSAASEQRFEQVWNVVKDIDIPEYDINRVTLHIIVTWHDLFESLQKDWTLEELIELKQKPDGWFVQTIHDSTVWEVAVEDAIKEIEDNQEIWDIILSNACVLYDDELQKYNPESKQFVYNLYKKVYDPIADKVSELVTPEVIYYCNVAINKLKTQLTQK